jgi:hypothetical protein
MKIQKLKVRPKKEVRAAPCAAEFATMLACWASSNDLSNEGQCAQTAKALQACMRTKVRSHSLRSTGWTRSSQNEVVLTPCAPALIRSQAKGQVVSRPTINYHLARFNKQL